jgi:hypothetical protein
MIQRDISVKLNNRSVRAKIQKLIYYILFYIYLPSAINVQLLKFFVRDRLDNIIIVRTFPGIPIRVTIIIYGTDIWIRIF